MHIKGWPGSQIVITFVVFDVEQNSECYYDYVEVMTTFLTVFLWYYKYLRACLPEAVIKDKDKWSHPTVSMRCNYLHLSLVPASSTQILIRNKIWCYYKLTKSCAYKMQFHVALGDNIFFWSIYLRFNLSLKWYTSFKKLTQQEHRFPNQKRCFLLML